ncbi:MAG: hypothetical protein Q8K86_07875 [Candidatus Nanopelagicaceae bacterium]|nr:hypothetical protein [Candidatus Nanopelagicaceae bacterium]
MKRALLIAGGTVGGLGAVLSITPPQLGSQGMANLSSSVNGAGSAVASAASSQTAKAVVPQATSGVVSASASSVSSSVSPKATAKKKTTLATKKATATKKVAAANSPTSTTNSRTTTPATQTPAPVVTKSAAPTSTANNVSGTFAGSSVFVNYGTVQVEITVVNGKITDAHALQAPTGRSDRFTQYAVPVLRQQTLAAQSANIQGASGASYTSYGWYTSLQVALAKAGL